MFHVIISNSLPIFAGWGVGLLLGIALWLLGGRLVRGMCVLTGLLVGGFLGLVITESALHAGEGIFLLPLTLGGAIVGAILAGLLFRIWMAITGAMVLAFLGVAVMWLYLGAAVPEQHESAEQTQVSQDASDDTSEAVLALMDAQIEEHTPAVDDTDDPIKQQSRRIINEVFSQSRVALRHVYTTSEALVQEYQPWWEALDTRSRRMIYAGLIIGAILGLLLGFTSPEAAASLQSVVIGSILILMATGWLLHELGEPWSDYWPEQFRSLLLIGAILGLVGFVIQLTAFRKRTESEG